MLLDFQLDFFRSRLPAIGYC